MLTSRRSLAFARLARLEQWCRSPWGVRAEFSHISSRWPESFAKRTVASHFDCLISPLLPVFAPAGEEHRFGFGGLEVDGVVIGPSAASGRTAFQFLDNVVDVVALYYPADAVRDWRDGRSLWGASCGACGFP